ncbi:actin-related protein 2/3 complex subunit 1, putative [Plasmodium berghei]|uniref:Arp2/3 complex 41 kDa subunit n=2 Tax=Plasmodium berghei TaxID=5821 RepID=A0A509AII0_PLABA|nr:actin-related protein 2/3 complex subunit 1, putative [Plasmodium berghei ANKA]CXI44160.1 actin-related protein 2/3 complex subunit 1, putative [Plasmodium berghei]SCM22466.1 actin-related protein 2/3 complex subunit 1, putative [Plasmodium berghei]SCN25468.1 actin-related protein 2/3 complex subunit 1, putative [Plasmodium berghei]SCO60429.1 actin-related protein 2/3 complex subunit 1, putative [Plasmodium berghei]SCO62224.1 actin-related protein 2/3 complex subunit 1, putative [Plasmodium|eukprot:XP_034421643.1 actin-related protein 2/3 complex subunit 1, putative [Plasmodium berghei ANKA]
MIEYLKCNCVKYSIPDEEYNIPIKLSPNKKEMLIAVVNTKNNIVLYKIINTEIIYFDILYTGSRNKIIGLEWSAKNELLIVTIDMKCVIFKKNQKGKWECTNVNISTEELPTCVCWHPHANTFAIGFSSGAIFICSLKEKKKWVIKKVENHTGSILFLDWSSSGYILSTSSLDSTSLLIYTPNIVDEETNNKDNLKLHRKFEECIAERNFKNNDIINKIECTGYILCHSSFSLSNEKVAIIASSFDNSCKKQKIIISDFLKSPINIQSVTWVGQTLQKCLFLDNERLLVYGYEVFPIIIECINNEWIISRVVLPEFIIKNLSVDFFYDKKSIKDIEQTCNELNGNEIIGEIVAHSNSILQLSMLETCEDMKNGKFVTVSSDFNVVIWNYNL